MGVGLCRPAWAHFLLSGLRLWWLKEGRALDLEGKAAASPRPRPPRTPEAAVVREAMGVADGGSHLPLSPAPSHPPASLTTRDPWTLRCRRNSLPQWNWVPIWQATREPACQGPLQSALQGAAASGTLGRDAALTLPSSSHSHAQSSPCNESARPHLSGWLCLPGQCRPDKPYQEGGCEEGGTGGFRAWLQTACVYFSKIHRAACRRYGDLNTYFFKGCFLSFVTMGIFYPVAYQVPKAEAVSSQVHWGLCQAPGCREQWGRLISSCEFPGPGRPQPWLRDGHSAAVDMQPLGTGTGRVWEEGWRSSFSPGAVSAGQGREPQ